MLKHRSCVSDNDDLSYFHGVELAELDSTSIPQEFTPFESIRKERLSSFALLVMELSKMLPVDWKSPNPWIHSITIRFCGLRVSNWFQEWNMVFLCSNRQLFGSDFFILSLEIAKVLESIDIFIFISHWWARNREKLNSGRKLANSSLFFTIYCRSVSYFSVCPFFIYFSPEYFHWIIFFSGEKHYESALKWLRFCSLLQCDHSE